MAFEYAFDAVDDGGEDAYFDHGHAEFDQHYNFYYICSFFHVEFVGNSEIDDALGSDFGAAKVAFIDCLLYSETEATEIAGD